MNAEYIKDFKEMLERNNVTSGYNSISEVRAANSIFFSRDTMRFWGSKVISELKHGHFFITTEKNFNDTERFYNIRFAYKSSENKYIIGKDYIHTVGEFNEIRNKQTALDIIAECNKQLLIYKQGGTV